MYQLVPAHSYVLEKEARKVRGTKDGRYKARLTMNEYVNATGTFRFISLIGTAAMRVCISGRRRELPMPYYCSLPNFGRCERNTSTHVVSEVMNNSTLIIAFIQPCFRESRKLI